MIGAEIHITNELARQVGRLAAQHPDESVHIFWDDSQDEAIWKVEFGEAARYLVNDDTGSYAQC